MDTQSLALLKDIQASLRSLQQEHRLLAASVDTLRGKVSSSASENEVMKPTTQLATIGGVSGVLTSGAMLTEVSAPVLPTVLPSSSPAHVEHAAGLDTRRGSLTSRIILTTYPGQSGIDPLPMKWGAANPGERGPVTVSRHTSTVRRRNGENDC